MLTIKNQITYMFSLGDGEDGKDFIDPTNFSSFVLYENAGNLRPTIELSFILTNKKLIKYLNSGNILSISFGIEELSKDTIRFELYGDNTNVNYSLGYNITIKGALYVPAFTSLVRSNYYGNVASINAIQQIAKKHKFNLITNINKTNDKQEWYQEGETDWKYLDELWLHSYINDKTFTAFALDSNNFYFYDVRELVKQPPKWTFSNKDISSKNSNIVNFSYYLTSNNYGAVNSLVGKNLINNVYNVDSNKFSNITYDLKNFTLIDTNKLNLNSKNCRDYDYYIIDDDFHANYIKAYNQNIRNNIMYSSFNIFISTAGQFKKLHLLDTVQINSAIRDDRISGTSFITAITYQIQDLKLLVNVTLNKEAASGIKGNDLEVGE